MTNWYYAEGGNQIGPVPEERFNQLVAEGAIRPGTLVWHEGMENWQPFQPQLLTLQNFPAAGIGQPCCQCHQSFPPEEMIHYANNWICAACKPLFFQRLSEGSTRSGPLNYAGFWIRFGAKIIDNIIIVATGVILSLVFGGIVGLAFSDSKADWGAVLVMCGAVGLYLSPYLVGVPYNTWMLGRFGATWGKMACGLRVVRANGQPLTYGRAFGRACGDLLSRLIFGIGYIIAAFDTEKRSLHDHLCDTRVTFKDP